MNKLILLLGVSAVVILIAYVFNDPIPDGVSQPVFLKISLGIYKLVVYMSKCAGYLGFNEAVALQKIIHASLKLVPLHTDARVSVKDGVFDDVPVRIYTPKLGDNRNRRGIMYYHGGGWTTLTLDAYESLMLQLCTDLDAVVVSVDYRLAPHHVFPTAVDDCDKATRYFINNAGVYGVDYSRIAISGDSAGGNLAAAISLRLRDAGFKQMPKLQVLIYPIVQALNLDTPSYRANKNGPLLTKDAVTLYVASYLFGNQFKLYIHDLYKNNHTTSILKRSTAKTLLDINLLPDDNLRKDYSEHVDFGNAELWNEIQNKMLDPDFAPLFAKDHSRLPKAYISTCQHDVLRDDGFFYAKKLRDANVDVTHVNLDACYHAWLLLHRDIATFKTECVKLIQFINNNL